MAFLTSLVLAVFCTLKVFGIDRDYTRYLHFFEQISLVDPDSRHGDGFDASALLVKVIFGTGSFDLWIFLVAFSSLLIKLALLSIHRNYVSLFFLYFLIVFPLHEMMQVKAGLATSLAYLGLFLTSHYQRSIIVRVGLLWVSTTVHLSTLVFAPFILSRKLFTRPSHVLGLTLIVFPTIIFSVVGELISQVFPVIDLYVAALAKEEEVEINPFSARIITLVGLLFLGMWNIKFLSQRALPWLYFSLFGMGLWVGLMWIPVIAHRLLELTIFSYLMWTPYLPSRARGIAFSALALFGFYFFYRSLTSFYG